MNLIANKRYDREMEYEMDDKDANTAVREAVARVLGHTRPASQIEASRRDNGDMPAIWRWNSTYVNILQEPPGAMARLRVSRELPIYLNLVSN